MKRYYWKLRDEREARHLTTQRKNIVSEPRKQDMRSSENLTRTDYCAQCGANFIAVHLPWAHTYVIGCRRCGTTAETVEELALAELPQEQGERLWARLQQLLVREETSEREEWRFGGTLNIPYFT